MEMRQGPCWIITTKTISKMQHLKSIWKQVRYPISEIAPSLGIRIIWITLPSGLSLHLRPTSTILMGTFSTLWRPSSISWMITCQGMIKPTINSTWCFKFATVSLLRTITSRFSRFTTYFPTLHCSQTIHTKGHWYKWQTWTLTWVVWLLLLPWHRTSWQTTSSEEIRELSYI